MNKEQVRQHWEEETAGVRYGQGVDDTTFYKSIEDRRYILEPFILPFAEFPTYTDKLVLEIGIGAGVDFSQFVRHKAFATGVDLTQSSANHVLQRLKLLNAGQNNYSIAVADAEALPFRDDTYELVYSWGVLHHTPNTVKAFNESLRVMKPGAKLKAMIYHSYSWTGWLLWLRYSLLRGKPFIGPRQCIQENLESPGTKSYTENQARDMLEKLGFIKVNTRTKLGRGDFLNIKMSEKYQGFVYKLIQLVYPRWLVQILGDRFGLYMLITAEKPFQQPK